MDMEDRVRGRDMPLHEGASGMEYRGRGIVSGMLALLVSLAVIALAAIVLVVVRTEG